MRPAEWRQTPTAADLAGNGMCGDSGIACKLWLPSESVTRARLGIVLGIIVTAGLALFCAMLGVWFLGDALSAHRDPLGPGEPYAYAAGSFVFFGLLVWVAIEFEHRLRGTARSQYDLFSGSARDDRASGRGWRRSRSRHAPIAVSLFLLVFLTIVIGSGVYAVNIYSQGALSSYVQHDGVSRTGGIVMVKNVEHQGSRSGPWYSALITVALAPPVGGHSTTVVHDPDGSDLPPGEGLRILVDPQQPSYAELPGQPFVKGWLWIIPGTLSLAFGMLGVLPIATMIVRMIGRYRRRGNLLGEHRRHPVVGGM